MRRLHAPVIGLALVLATVSAPTPAAAPQASAPTPVARGEIDRLVALGRLWTTVRYAHPYLTYKDIDWDAALVAAIPKVRVAATPDELATAVSGMLAALGDPATRLRPIPPAPSAGRGAPSTPPRPVVVEQTDGVLTLRMNDYAALADFGGTSAALQQQMMALREATAVIVDVRQRVPGPGAFALAAAMKNVAGALTARPIAPPATRVVMHSGYAPQTGSSSGGYYSALQLTMPEAIQPVPRVAEKRLAFLVNQGGTLPDVALALQRSGDGIIVSEGAMDDSSVVPSLTVNLGQGLVAAVRTGEVVHGDEVGVRADVEIPAAAGSDGGDAAMKAALAFVKGGSRPAAPAAAKAAPAVPVWRADRTYGETPYPSVEHRILGVYRLWGVINYFFPYKHLMTRDWNGSMEQFLPRVIAAKDAMEYGLAVAEMATWLEDSHVNVSSMALRPFYGEATLPITVRYIENVPVITGLVDEAAAQAAGVRVGDVLNRIDGEDVATRAKRFEPYVTASNPWSLRTKLARYLLTGPDASTAALTVTGADGRAREITLTRKVNHLAGRPPAPPQPTFRMLDGNIGYVDLTRFEPREIDPMFDALGGARAIVFDMRGYPRGVFMSLSPRLNRKNARFAATFLRPVLQGGSAGTSFTFQQGIPTTARPIFQGRTVMLIDDRAISQSEHTGLFLEMASDVTFIGSRTTGANGDVTRLILPGGVMVGFTGHDVRHADGRQLQKVGLEPHIEIAPTIKGIRDGRDELLERAVRFVNEGK